ncbi:hypothetical protein A2U01_0011688, partial [Trifolium medium]|nr:hypothetical protein [Trifolium medium]
DLMQKPMHLSYTFNSLGYESQVDFWNQMKTCMYSVRSSYHLAMTNLVDSEHLKASGNWMIIWQLANQSHEDSQVVGWPFRRLYEGSSKLYSFSMTGQMQG